MIITLVKFINNRLKDSNNELITRTLGKVGVIKRNHSLNLTNNPKHDEFWFVEIIKETFQGEAKGCWLLRPISKVGYKVVDGSTEPDIIRLIPGTFEVLSINGTLYVFPNIVDGLNGPNWILDVETKRSLMKSFAPVNSTVVVLNNNGRQLFQGASQNDTSTGNASDD